MSRKEQRILRVMMEVITEGLSAHAREGTWKRMLEQYRPARRSEVMDDEAKINAVLEEIEISRKEFHEEIIRCCEHGLSHEPSADYPERGDDQKYMESLDFDSWLPADDLMTLGQQAVIQNIRRVRNSKILRERLAKRCAIKLI